MKTKNIGLAIRANRKTLGLSMYDLAARLNCTAPYISAIENGTEIPSILMAKKLSKTLKIDHKELSNQFLFMKIEKIKWLTKSEKELFIKAYIKEGKKKK